MAYAFNKDLETGNKMIDEQHKELFIAINNLLEACSKGKGRTELEATLEFLNGYVAKHFGDEEKLQLATKYPDYKNHKQYHEGYKKVVADISNELKKTGPTIVLVGKVNTSIAEWLINHIKREDVKVAAHVRETTGK